MNEERKSKEIKSKTLQVEQFYVLNVTLNI